MYCALQKEVMEGTASGSALLCFEAGAWLSSGSSQGVSQLSMPFFTWSSLLLIPPPSSLLQATLPTTPVKGIRAAVMLK